MRGEGKMADYEVISNKRAKAAIWRHFGLRKRRPDCYRGGVAVCRQCDTTVKCTGGGTSNMTTHMRHNSDLKTEIPKLFNSPPTSPAHTSNSAPTTPLKSYQPLLATSFASQSVPTIIIQS